MRDTDVFFCAAVAPGPGPGLIKHAPVQAAHVGFRDRVLAGEVGRRERPSVRLEDVAAFPLIQLLSGSQGREQAGLFVGGQRSLAVRLIEQAEAVHGWRLRVPRCWSKRWVSASIAASIFPEA